MVKRIISQVKPHIAYLFLILCISALFYNGFSYLNELPQGMHFWKQTLHFSMIQNYVNSDVPLWHPEINNLFNGDSTGKLILEFPVLHKATALLIQVFPFVSPVIFRWLIFLLTMIGFFHIYKLGILILKEKLYAILSTLLVFVIPIITYYGANYLVDVPAMVFSFSTIYFLEKNNVKKSNWNLIAAALFLFLSGALRLPALIPFISYLIIKTVYRQKLADILWLLPSLASIVIWYMYVNKFNTYWIAVPPYTTYGFITPELTADVKELFIKFMAPQFGWGYRFWAFYVLVFAFLAFRWREVSRFWFFVLVINVFGSCLYFFLWFGLFNHHDYYLIPVVSNAVLIWINVFYASRNFKFNKVVVFLSVILLLLNILNTFNNERRRLNKPKKIEMLCVLAANYEGIFDYYQGEDARRFSEVTQISPYNGSTFLTDYGIQQNDTVICDFDVSPAYVLSLLQLKGWTLYNSEYKSLNDYKKFVEDGAKYLFTNNLYQTPLDSISQCKLKSDKIFQFNNLVCYNIEKLKNDTTIVP